MGLPGAGKTTLADALAKKIKAKRLNADEVRKIKKIDKYIVFLITRRKISLKSCCTLQ